MAKYLIDTCLLVYVTRGVEDKVRGLESLRGAVVSYVTYGELIQGVRNKQELKMVEEIVSDYTLDGGGAGVWQMAIEILKKHHHSDGIGLVDAIIAAQAILRDLVLITENLKHFRQIEGLVVKKLAEVI
ncbi:MAG: PIN domain-containing protein [bacterium]